VRNQVTIPLYVMIRPRGGNLLLCRQRMGSREIRNPKLQTKKSGWLRLLGILHPDNTNQYHSKQKLVALAHPLPCTFHRAFDAASEGALAWKNSIDCGFTTILTSGIAPNVTEEGKDGLTQSVTLANSRITIMPGGGLRFHPT